MYRTDLRIREVVKRFVSYIISSSLAFSFIVLLRDNEKIYSLTGYQDTRSEMKNRAGSDYHAAHLNSIRA